MGSVEQQIPRQLVRDLSAYEKTIFPEDDRLNLFPVREEVK